MRKLYSLILVLFCLSNVAQIKFDSLFHIVDTTKKFKNKLHVLYNASKKTTLTNNELELIISKIREITSNESSASKHAYELFYISNIHITQKENNSAIPVLFEALKISEKHNETKLTGDIHNKLGNCFKDLDNEPFAKKHYNFAIQYYKGNNDAAEDLSEMYNALGTMYKNNMILDSALYFHKMALEIRLKLKNKKLLASTYNNIGLVYKKKKNNQEALNYLKKALEIRRELKDKKGTAGALINTASVLCQMNKNKEALPLLFEGTVLAYSINDGNYYKNGIDVLGDCYYGLGEFKKSAEHYLRYNEIEDSLTSGAIDKQILELSTQYESSKKDAEINLQQEKVKTQQSEIKKQQLFMATSILVIILVVMLVFFAYRSNRINKRNAFNLERKNVVIEQKNREITDSINYARRIQNSILAPEAILKEHLPEHFILYKPKDIVSGDFYWFLNDSDKILLGVADCTGHGVPGAFMSLIGKEKLDKASSTSDAPSEILQYLNNNVKAALQQDATQISQDGMDIALIKLQRNDKGATVHYSGANRPLWIIRNNSEMIEEVKPTKHAIAGFTPENQIFEEHIIRLDRGDTIYLFTDGYADQFGGEHSKKLTSKSFKKLLLSQHNKPLDDQKKYYNEFINKWMSGQEQVDDILILGIKI